jgi:hypothetical protein
LESDDLRQEVTKDEFIRCARRFHSDDGHILEAPGVRVGLGTETLEDILGLKVGHEMDLVSRLLTQNLDLQLTMRTDRCKRPHHPEWNQ